MGSARRRTRTDHPAGRRSSPVARLIPLNRAIRWSLRSRLTTHLPTAAAAPDRSYRVGALHSCPPSTAPPFVSSARVVPRSRTARIRCQISIRCRDGRERDDSSPGREGGDRRPPYSAQGQYPSGRPWVYHTVDASRSPAAAASHRPTTDRQLQPHAPADLIASTSSLAHRSHLHPSDYHHRPRIRFIHARGSVGIA